MKNIPKRAVSFSYTSLQLGHLMIPDKETIRAIKQFTDITHPQHPNINLLL
jgi:hypothetical protein